MADAPVEPTRFERQRGLAMAAEAACIYDKTDGFCHPRNAPACDRCWPAAEAVMASTGLSAQAVAWVFRSNQKIEQLAAPAALPKADEPSVAAVEAADKALLQLAQMWGDPAKLYTPRGIDHFALALDAFAAQARTAGFKEAIEKTQPGWRDLSTALRMIRDAVEELGPTGAVPSRDVGPPNPIGEAEDVIAGVVAIEAQARTAAIKECADFVRRAGGSFLDYGDSHAPFIHHDIALALSDALRDLARPTGGDNA